MSKIKKKKVHNFKTFQTFPPKMALEELIYWKKKKYSENRL